MAEVFPCHGNATLVGLGRRADADAAALINATAGTFLEMDEGNYSSHHDFALADVANFEAGCRAQDEGFDAVCIDTMSDSGVAPLRSVMDIPVFGPGKASMLAALMLGDRFSILAMSSRWKPLYKKALDELGLHRQCASVRAPLRRHRTTRPCCQDGRKRCLRCCLPQAHASTPGIVAGLHVRCGGQGHRLLNHGGCIHSTVIVENARRNACMNARAAIDGFSCDRTGDYCTLVNIGGRTIDLMAVYLKELGYERPQPAPPTEFFLCETEDGGTRVECRFVDESLWLCRALTAALFQVPAPTVNGHLKNLYAVG